jgi:hypothetical protein
MLAWWKWGSEMSELEKIELELRALLRGKQSSLTLSFNDDNGPNYVADSLDHDAARDENVRWYSFRSPEERQECCNTNSVWTLQWYPETPIGSYSISAPTLEKLFAFLHAEMGE